MMPFKTWAAAYRGEARRDRHRRLLAWREREGFEAGLPWARAAVRVTVRLVAQAVASLRLDGNEKAVDRLLRAQVYDPAAACARYLLEFEAGDVAWARIYVDDLKHLDLDHLHRSAGFRHLTIRRVDGKDLRAREVDALKAAVRNDFGADAGAPEEEVAIHFDQDADRLHVMPCGMSPQSKPALREHDEAFALRLLANGGGSHPLREHPWYDEAAIAFSLEEPDAVSVFLRRREATRRRFDFRIVPVAAQDPAPEGLGDVPRDVSLEAGKRFLCDTVDLLKDIPVGRRRGLLQKALAELRAGKQLRTSDARLLESLLRAWPKDSLS